MRGVSSLEYVIVLAAVVVGSGAAMKGIGVKTGLAANNAGTSFTTSAPPPPDDGASSLPGAGGKGESRSGGGTKPGCEDTGNANGAAATEKKDKDGKPCAKGGAQKKPDANKGGAKTK